jgi:hypothetical protein
MGRYLLLWLLLVGVFLFFLDIDHGPSSAFPQLYGFAHLGFFACMAGVLSRLPAFAARKFLVQCVLIMTLVFLAGGIIELIQPFFGRAAKWRDLGIDLLGGLLGLMFLSPVRHVVKQGRLVILQMSVLAVASAAFYMPAITLWDMGRAWRQFPVLSDFETRFEARRWSNGMVTGEIARHGERSLRVSINTEKYAGTSLVRSFGNWRGYSSLAFSLYNPDAEPLSITVSIRDEEHFRRGGDYHDRFNRAFKMEHGWNDVRIPVAEIENAPAARRLQLNQLSEVVIFTVDPPEPKVVYLDYVHLIR